MFRSVRQCARLLSTVSARSADPSRSISSGISRISGGISSVRSGLLASAHPTTFSQPRRNVVGVLDSSLKPKLSQETVQERVLTVCKNFDKLTKEKLKLESNFMNDLGLDSLDHVELVMAFEDEFGYEISDIDGEKLVRPADVVKFIIERQSSPDAASLSKP